MSWPAGTTDGLLAGRYRLESRIAVGGMGEVWRGVDTVLGRAVAVKCLKPEYVGDPEFRERFRGEARHAAGLSHPGIASVYDYGEQLEPEKAAWLVMELVDGEPLSALLHRQGALDPDAALSIVGQAAMALEAAHLAGVVHRDVKPGNLLVRPDGVVKVTDFGIARATNAVPITRTGTMVGTAYYMSPEQASGAPVTPASDVYSLGVVAYECLAGRRPFPGDNAVAVATAHLHDPAPPLPDHLPAQVRALVSRAMEKDPSRRPAHAGELGRTALGLRSALSAGSDATTRLTPDSSPALTRILSTVGPAVAVLDRPARRLPDLSPGRNHRRAVRLASALLAVVVIGLSLRSCGAGGGAPTVVAPSATASSTTTSSTTASSPTAVSVVSASYVGQDPAAVSAALTELGLQPTLTSDGSGSPAGTVGSVSPAGQLAPGSPIVVHVVPAAAPLPAPANGKGKRGKGKHG